jgi:DNA polymerase III epsilon subunit-like protein
MDELATALRGLGVRDGARPFIVAFDTEGSSRSGGIREIGAAAVEDDGVTFCEIVTQRAKAEGLAPADAARTWSAVGPRFAAWLARAAPPGRPVLLVGHNVTRHDLPLLRAETAACCPEVSWAGVSWADTLEATRAQLPELARRDLASVYKHLFGAEPPRHCSHTALADARATAAVAGRLSAALEAAAAPLELTMKGGRRPKKSTQ